MKIALALIACLALPAAAEATPPRIPLGLMCNVAEILHSDKSPDPDGAATDSEYVGYSNRCISVIQDYTRVHCPQTERTIWQQVEAVAYNGRPGITDAQALTAACRS